MFKSLSLFRKAIKINDKQSRSIKSFLFVINKFDTISRSFCFSTKKLFKGKTINPTTNEKQPTQQFEPQVYKRRKRRSKTKTQKQISLNQKDSQHGQNDTNVQPNIEIKKNGKTFTKLKDGSTQNFVQNASKRQNLSEQKKGEGNRINKYLNNDQNNKRSKQKKNQKKLFEKQVPNNQTDSQEAKKDFMLEKHLRLFEASNMKPMTTLKSVLKEVNEQMEFPDQQYFQQNFFYVLNPENIKEPLAPFGFRYFLFKFTKYHMYFSQSLSQQDLACMDLKSQNTVIYYCLNNHKDREPSQNNLKLPDEKINYMEHFLTNLLGHDSKFFYEIFLQVGIDYFRQLKQQLKQLRAESKQQQYIPSRNVLQIIQTNIHRLIIGFEHENDIDSLQLQDYSRERQLFTLFLDFYCIRKHQFDINDKIACTNITKFLKISHPDFLQFIKETIQTDQQNYSTVEFLVMLGYLVESKNTPYEYFYKNKGTWMKIVESAHDFSDKKTQCCIRFLEILSRQRFVNCQKIYFSLLQSIENNLQAMEGKQLVRVLYFYSKTRYGMSPRFLSNLVDKISRWLPLLEQNHFSLLVRAIGNLNYQSAELVQKLKNINYERFLSELKYGCESLGSYYQEILKEVEQQSKGRDYFDGEEQFLISPQTNAQEMKISQKVV